METPEGRAASDKRTSEAARNDRHSCVCCASCGDDCQLVQEGFAEVEKIRGRFVDCKAALKDVREEREYLNRAEEYLKIKRATLKVRNKETMEKKSENIRWIFDLEIHEKDLLANEHGLKRQVIDRHKRQQDLDARQQALLSDEASLSNSAQVDKDVI
ncbi:hypothetical protein M433DRAFT_133418 [Acidomyces richmondensis BFW]|nr:hypothetical protein M433DRAFT_133418 [Acidomyces richmondensis BFW]